MDKVRKFDRQMEKTFESIFFYGKTGAFILCGLGLMFMMIPAGFADIPAGAVWISCLLCVTGVNQYTHCYLKVRENGRSISIYKKLKFMPVSKAEIRKARFAHLNHFCVRLCTAGFLIQQLASLLNHSFGKTSVLSALMWAAAVWAAGGCSVWFG